MQCPCKLLIARQSNPGEPVKAIGGARCKKAAEAEKWAMCIRVRTSEGRNRDQGGNSCPHACTMSSLTTESSCNFIQHASQSMTCYSEKNIKGSILPFCRNRRGSRAEEMAQRVKNLSGKQEYP